MLGVFSCLCSLRSLINVFYVFALCLRIRSAMESWSVDVGSGGRYSSLSLLILGCVIGDIKRPPGACRSTESEHVGCWVNSKDPVSTASKSGLVGWVL